jgi:hypothetical protein
MAHRHADLSDANVRLDSRSGALSLLGIAAAVAGLGGAVALSFAWGVEPERFWRIWLQNFMFVLSLALGGLFFVLVQFLTRAGWSVTVRRVAEAFAANLRWIWILFLPIVGLAAMGDLHRLFPWADLKLLAELNPAEASIVETKAGYFAPWFFWGRAVGYFVVWAGLAHYFWTRSTRQDSEGGTLLTQRMQRLAAPGMILFGVTLTFASVDWIMSLNPAWFSTMFGVYFFAASCTGSFAAIILALLALRSQHKLVGLVNAEHLQELGKMLFAFGMVFWAYIAFSQFMLIWYANIPEETVWFLARQVGEWKWLSVALLIGHFVIPFLLLISKHPKRMPFTLGFVATWMLLFHWLDLYWLIVPPTLHDAAEFTSYDALVDAHADASAHLLDPVNWLALLGMLGLFLSFTVQSLRSRALVPVSDPRLHEALAFENL